MGIQVERMYGKVGDHTGQAEAGGSGRLTFTCVDKLRGTARK